MLVGLDAPRTVLYLGVQQQFGVVIDGASL